MTEVKIPKLGVVENDEAFPTGHGILELINNFLL
jgi:hypothetical protein